MKERGLLAPATPLSQPGRPPRSASPSRVVVTRVRRGELCGLQIRDIDLDRGLVHVAFNYVVRGGQRFRWCGWQPRAKHHPAASAPATGVVSPPH